MVGFLVENMDIHENTAKIILIDLEKAAVNRLNEELKQSKIALNKGDSLTTQIKIISTWKDWYQKSFDTTSDMVSDTKLINNEIEKSKKLIDSVSKSIIDILTKK